MFVFFYFQMRIKLKQNLASWRLRQKHHIMWLLSVIVLYLTFCLNGLSNLDESENFQGSEIN